MLKLSFSVIDSPVLYLIESAITSEPFICLFKDISLKEISENCEESIVKLFEGESVDSGFLMDVTVTSYEPTWAIL